MLRYLKGTIDYGLTFQEIWLPWYDNLLKCWLGNDPNDIRSTSGYYTYLVDHLISWSSKKQSVISKSSTYSEYKAIALACVEITWICSILKELDIRLESTPLLLGHSISAIAITTDQILHSKTKYIEIDIHFVRGKVKKKEVEIPFVSNNDQIVDVLTKPLTYPKFSFFKDKSLYKRLKFKKGCWNH